MGGGSCRAKRSPVSPAGRGGSSRFGRGFSRSDQVASCTTPSSRYKSWKSCRCRSTVWLRGVSQGSAGEGAFSFSGFRAGGRPVVCKASRRHSRFSCMSLPPSFLIKCVPLSFNPGLTRNSCLRLGLADSNRVILNTVHTVKLYSHFV